MDRRGLVKFGWEPLKSFLAEPNARDIVAAYHGELWGEARVPCAPDWDRRQAMEDAFQYRLWTARVDETLAGFIEFQVAPTLNASTTLFAIDVGHFILPAFRGNARLGHRMWASAMRALEELGVGVVMAHDNMTHPLMPFFLSLGMRPTGITFMKVLGQ